MKAILHEMNVLASFSNNSKLLAEYLIMHDVERVQYFSELINILIL